ncbi:NAD-dependent epimerase/dehydratase family protein [Halovenus halobia]|uniref:NAD-dependent epimerase/dehydratase family protein n=1 Tax=Halovenus halobia TaxID=3396622 RepID=UPI003F546AFE
MSERALVTGACGFTGTKLVEQLLEANWDVVATDLTEADRGQFYTETDNAPHPAYDPTFVNEQEEVPFYPADITERETLEPIFESHEFDVVFHPASLFDYFADWDQLHAVNVEGARNVAELAAAAGVDQFVHFSTLGVLGAAGFDEPKSEDESYNPHNEYCESKVEQERVLHSVRDEQDLPLTIIRPAPIYGPGNQYGVYHVLLVVSKLGFAPIYRIYPRSKQFRFPSIHVEDLSRIALFLTEKRAQSIGETYNAVSDCINQDELLSFLGESLGVPRIRLPTPYRVYKLWSKYAEIHSRRIHKIAQERDKRPKIDAPITQYLSNNMWYSNKKIRELGFEFTYRDPRRGLWEYITWCKERGVIA